MLMVSCIAGLSSTLRSQAIDSLEKILSTAAPDTNKVNTLNEIGYENYALGNFNETKKFGTEALILSQKLGYKKGEGTALLRIGMSYKDQGDYPKALDYLLRSLKIRESLNDKAGVGSCMNNIGLVYHNMQDYKKALEYHHKAMALKAGIGDKKGIANSLNNIGIIYEIWVMHDTALNYHQRALKIREEIADKAGIMNSLVNIGNIHTAKSELNEALEYYQRALILNKEIGNKNQQSNMLNNIASVYVAQGKLKEAVPYLDEAIRLAKEMETKEHLQLAYNTYSLLYESKKDFVTALKYYHLYFDVKDSLLNNENSEYIAKMNAEFENEKKDNEIKLLNVDKEKQETLMQTERKKQLITTSSIGLGLISVLLFSIFIYRSNLQKQKANTEISRQKGIIEERNREVHDSITYAKRIQAAILPPDRLLKEALPEHFILYKPKDIVSGDFYWLEKAKDRTLFAAVDCTGHGVPGAMVSVVGHNSLNRCVKEFGLTDPALILDKLTQLVEETFERSENEVKDGMDISLCSLSRADNKLYWAGANNPLWLLRDGKIQEIKADKQPIGKFENRKPFTLHTLQLQKGDSIYILTDGYADQFGGPKGKKFKYKQLEEQLIASHHKSMDEQKQILDKAFEEWKAGLEQIDDVCIIGVRV